MRLAKKRYRFKFNRTGQELAKELDEKSRALYDKQLIKHRARERKARQLYRKKVKLLASQKDPKAMEKYERTRQINYASVVRHRQRKKVERAGIKTVKPRKPPIEKRKKTILPDLNKSPPPDMGED